MNDLQALLGGKPGETVPEVNPANIKAAWKLYEHAAKRHPGEQVAVGHGAVETVCTPGANVPAVCYRAMMLQAAFLFRREELRSWIQDGQLDDALFRAAATTPMQWMGVGIEYEGGLPFDLEDFMRHVRGE